MKRAGDEAALPGKKREAGGSLAIKVDGKDLEPGGWRGNNVNKEKSFSLEPCRWGKSEMPKFHSGGRDARGKIKKEAGRSKKCIWGEGGALEKNG